VLKIFFSRSVSRDEAMLPKFNSIQETKVVSVLRK
jgi:hypothetical protein